ncbi:MAG: O-antigen polymerase [Candidatus Aenigmatarchaeota archaeon]
MIIDNPKERITVGTFLGIITGMFIIFLANTTNVTTNLLLYVLAFSVMFLILYEYKGNLFSPVFLYLIKFFVFYVFSAAIWISTSPSKEDNIYSLGLFYCLLALIFFYIGYRSQIGKIIGLRIHTIKGKWEKPRVIVAIVVSFLIGFISFLLLIYLNGGIINFLAYMWNRSRLIQGLGPLRNLTDFIGLSVLITLISIFTLFKKSWLAKLFFLFLIIFWIFVCLFLGGRGFLIWQLFTLLFIYNYMVKKIKITHFIIIILASFVFLNVFLEIRKNSYRIFMHKEYPEIEQSEFFDIKSFVQTNFPFFNVFISLLEKVPSQYPHYLGKTYLEAFISVIPRAIWSEKPFGVASEVVYILYGYKFYHARELADPQTGPDIRLIDEAYLNFSWPGIIIMFLLYGIIMKIFMTYVHQYSQNKNVILVCGIFFPFIIYYLDGNSFMNMIRLFEYFVMLIFIKIIKLY